MLTWNIWWRFGPWEERAPAILRTLEEADADVVCLQEVWGEEGGVDQANELAQALGFRVARSPQRFWKGVSFGNAILSRWPISSTASEWLPGADALPSHRNVVLADIAAPFGAMPVVTTHLEWRYDASAIRSGQVEAVARFVAEHRGDPETGFPPVVTGDLNAVPHADEIRTLTGAAPPSVDGLLFHDAWAQGGEGHGHTWDRVNPYLVDASWPARRLDYVLVAWPRPRPLGNVVRCALVGNRPVAGVWPSDHFGVVAELRTS